jgi:hypothetical protein
LQIYRYLLWQSQKIITFFTKYPIGGVKLLDFQDLCKVANIMEEKVHLIIEETDAIIRIKEGMNNHSVVYGTEKSDQKR